MDFEWLGGLRAEVERQISRQAKSVVRSRSESRGGDD
jgi:hypothetical protein